MFGRVADLTWKHPKLILALVGAFAVFSVAVGKDVEHHLQAAGFTDSASESEKATAAVVDAAGYDPNPGLVLIVRGPGAAPLDTGDPAVRREVGRLSREVAGIEHVGRVVNPLQNRRAAAQLIARDGGSLIISVHVDTNDIEDKGGLVAEDAQLISDSSRLDVSMGGFAPSFNEVNDQTKSDLTKAELIAFPLLALLLLIVFRGVVAAGIPLLIGGISIVGTLFVLRVMSMFVDTSIFALNIATGLSLGLAVDYALLMVSRYREEIGKEGATRDAHRRMVTTAGRTAVFSGLTVATAMAALVLMPQRFLYSMAVAGASVGLLSALIAILVVPSLLALLGTRIDALSIRRGPSVSDESGGWYRLAHGVMRHPVGVALASGALLLVAAAPLLDRADRPELAVRAARQAVLRSELLRRTPLSARRHRGRQRRRRRPASPAQLAAFGRRIESLGEITRGAPFAPVGGNVSYAAFALRDQALDPPSEDAVSEIRGFAPPALRPCWSPATPPASSTRSRACSTTYRSWSGSSPAPRC